MATPLLSGNVSANQSRQLRLVANVTILVVGNSLLVVLLASLKSFLSPRLNNAHEKPSLVVDAVSDELVTITSRRLYREIKISGKLDYGDGQIVRVTAPLEGRVTEDSTFSPGDQVAEGVELFRIKSSPLLAGQRELLRTLTPYESTGQRQVAAEKRFVENPLSTARGNLLLLGIRPNQINEMVRTRDVSGLLSVKCPSDGVLLDSRVHPGQYVNKGDVVYRIAQPDPLWLFCEVPVRELPWISIGRRINVAVQGNPSTTLPAVITVISPTVDSINQTIQIGVPLPNRDGKLRRYMAVNGTVRVAVLANGTPEPTGMEGKFICSTHPQFVQDASGDCPKDGLLLVPVRDGRVRLKSMHGRRTLAVPVKAVFDQDGRKCVRRLMPTGDMETVNIKVGPMAQGSNESGKEARYYPVRAGLKEGDRVLRTPNRRRDSDLLIVSAWRSVRARDNGLRLPPQKS